MNITGLTDRQLAILRLKAAGLTAKQIGQQLFITPATAQAHVSHAIQALEVRNCVAAVVVAIRDGDIDPDELEIARRVEG